MTNYELKQIKGIPYYICETTVYTFELNQGLPADTCVPIGSYDQITDTIQYIPDWKERVQSRLDAYRNGLKSLERDKLRASITKPIKKQRKGTRNPRKSVKDKDVASK